MTRKKTERKEGLDVQGIRRKDGNNIVEGTKQAVAAETNTKG